MKRADDGQFAEWCTSDCVPFHVLFSTAVYVVQSCRRVALGGANVVYRAAVMMLAMEAHGLAFRDIGLETGATTRSISINRFGDRY